MFEGQRVGVGVRGCRRRSVGDLGGPGGGVGGEPVPGGHAGLDRAEQVLAGDALAGRDVGQREALLKL